MPITEGQAFEHFTRGPKSETPVLDQELFLVSRICQQVRVRAGNRFRRVLDGPLTALELLGDGLQNGGVIRCLVINPCVIGHPQGVPMRVNPPVAILVLLPQVVLGNSSQLVITTELTHPSAATDVARNDCHGGFVNQQTDLY